MPLVIPPGFSDVAIEMRGDGDPDPWYVTFGVDSSEAAGDVAAIGTTVNTAWDFVMTKISNTVTHTGCKVTVGQDGAEPVRGFSSAGTTGTGGGTGAKLPQNCSALVHKDTAIGGRRARGRFFIPAILDEAEVTNVGVLSAPLILALQTALDSFFVELQNNVIPAPMVLLHNSDGISPIIDPTPVTAVRLDQVISTQRRRLR